MILLPDCHMLERAEFDSRNNIHSAGKLGPHHGNKNVIYYLNILTEIYT